MNTAIINIRVEPKLKTEAQKVSEDLGFTLSTLIKAFLKETVRTRAISFNIPEVPSAWMIKHLKASREDIKAGRVSPTFFSVEEAVKYLRSGDRKNSFQQQIQETIQKKSQRNNQRISKKAPSFSGRSLQSPA